MKFFLNPGSIVKLNPLFMAGDSEKAAPTLAPASYLSFDQLNIIFLNLENNLYF